MAYFGKNYNGIAASVSPWILLFLHENISTALATVQLCDLLHTRDFDDSRHLDFLSVSSAWLVLLRAVHALVSTRNGTKRPGTLIDMINWGVSEPPAA